MEYHVTLDCNTTCALKDHVITMCRLFKKGEKQICMTSNDNNTPIYDTGNYRLLILIDYLDWMYQLRVVDEREDAISFGHTIDNNSGDSGMPAFFSGSTIEISYVPDVSSYRSIGAISDVIATQVIRKVREATNIN
jgi:hypothetical protein